MKPGGLYLIRCSANGKIYVGSAKNLLTRWLEHASLLDANKHFNRHLQSAWNLYGRENFNYEIYRDLGAYDRNKFFKEEDALMHSLREEGILLFNLQNARGGGQELTAEQAERRRQNMSKVGKHRIGNVPKNAKAIIVDGQLFPSIAAASRTTGKSYKSLGLSLKGQL